MNKKINELISNHEQIVANPNLLNYLNCRDDIKLIGKKEIKNKNRAPTIIYFKRKDF